jgi:predicted amidophosphoribosyltransferase
MGKLEFCWVCGEIIHQPGECADCKKELDEKRREM